MRSSEKVSLFRLSVLNVYEFCFVCVLSESVCFVQRRRWRWKNWKFDFTYRYRSTWHWLWCPHHWTDMKWLSFTFNDKIGAQLCSKLSSFHLYSMNILILQIALICVTSSQIKDKTVFSLNKNIRALPKTSMCCRSDVKKKTNYKSYLKNMLIFFKMMT